MPRLTPLIYAMNNCEQAANVLRLFCTSVLSADFDRQVIQFESAKQIAELWTIIYSIEEEQT